MARGFGSVRWIMGGTQDNGTDRYVGSYVWDHIADGDGGDCSVNHESPNSIYHTFYGMPVRQSTIAARTGRYRSASAGELQRFVLSAARCLGATVGRAGQSMWLSRNSGAALVGRAIPDNTVATAMHAPNADTFFVGCANGTIFRFDSRPVPGPMRCR